MSLPRVVRIHLVDQFIILSLIVFVVGYIEILPVKKFIFVAYFPVSVYQLLIVLVCSELIKLPRWLSWIEAENQEELGNQEELTDDNPDLLRQCPSDEFKSPKKYSLSPASSRVGLHSGSEQSRTEQSDSILRDANTQTVYQHVSDIFKKAPIAHRLESSKEYQLKSDKKRFDYNLKRKNFQPLRTRNCLSAQDKMCTDLDSKIPLEMPAWKAIDYFGHLNKKPRRKSISTEALDRESMFVDSHFELEEKNDFIRSMEVSDMLKKATKAHRSESMKNYPLKCDKNRCGYNFETKDTEPRRSLNIQTAQDEMSTYVDFKIPLEMPAWDALDYFGDLNKKPIRKSISTEALDRESMLVNSNFDLEEKNDFTRSMEVPKAIEPTVNKKGIKSSASFNKWKQGVSDYFNKVKQGNKQEINKTKIYKDQSELNEEKRAVLKSKSCPCPKYKYSVKENLI